MKKFNTFLQPARSENDERKKRRASLVKLAVMLVLTLVIWIFSSIAWFSMNKNVSSSGMGVKAGANGFELLVKGNIIENEAKYPLIDNNDYIEGVQRTDDNGDPIDAYITSGSASKIFWAKTANENGSCPNGLEPDAQGTLRFWVVPKTDNLTDVKFTFKVRGFYATTETHGEETIVTGIYEVTENLAPTQENELTQDMIDKMVSGLEYIQGHILFFKQYENSYYSGFLGADRTVHLSDYLAEGTSLQKDHEYEVKVEWKWANTFEQMVFSDSSPMSDDPLFASNNSSDREKMQTYLTNTNNHIFEGATLSEITSNLAKAYNNITTDDSDACDVLSDKYNDADQIIGNYLDFILIEMTAE